MITKMTYKGKSAEVNFEVGTPRAKKTAALFRFAQNLRKIRLKNNVTPGYTMYQLKDGKYFQADKLSVGGLCLTVDIELPVPLAPGDYELKDGRKFKIGQGGVIAEVKAGMKK